MKPRIFVRPLGIRGRVLLLTILPLMVMVLLLGYHLIDSRLEDSRSVLVDRGSLMVRQLALVSEFGLFSHNREMLGSIVEGVVFDDDVLWAAVLDHERRIVAQDGLVSDQELQAAFTSTGLEYHSPALFVVPIGVLVPPLSDFTEELEKGSATDADWPLGWAIVRLSLERSLERRWDILRGSLLLIGGGLLLSALLAMWVGRSIILPILDLNETVDNLRRGELSARVTARSSGELGHLETGFNEMAYALQEAQESLEQQVDTATQELQETVTTLQSSNLELSKAREQALQGSREKEEFLARMSHEIRTPLNAVIGFSRLLNGRPDAVETGEYIRTIDLAANQLLFLVDDILHFSRLQSGNMELESIEYDLPACLEDVVSMLSSAAHDKGLEFALLLHSDLPTRVYGDPNRVSQVLSNLLNNAIKFTDSGHVFVEVDCGESSGEPEVCIRVSDTGIGLTQEEKDRVFKAFSQGDNSVTRRFGGSGLGLAIAKRLASIMGGSIGVESEKSRGSVFHFSIPCRAASGVGQEEDIPPLAGRRVLLWDSQPLSRRSLRATLLRWHMTVFNSSNFEQLQRLLAADAGAETPCDLLLLGLSPRESGVEHFPALFSRLRDLYNGPVLILVGSERWRPPAPADLCSRMAWSAKPIRRSTLRKKICKLLQFDCDPADHLSEEPAKPPLFTGLRILSAEDNEFNRLLLRRLVEERGATMQDACSGHEAVEIAQQTPFDLILMDIHMPGLDGIEASRRIRAVLGDNSPPIIALTADLFVDVAETSQASVFDDHLAKPVIAEALERAITRWVGRNPAGHSAVSDPPGETAGAECQPAPTAERKSLLPPDLEEQLHAEIRRLCAELERFQDRPTGEEFADLAHQLRGLAGLYGLDELDATVRDLTQSARNNVPRSIAPALQRLAAIVDVLPQPTERRS